MEEEEKEDEKEEGGGGGGGGRRKRRSRVEALAWHDAIMAPTHTRARVTSEPESPFSSAPAAVQPEPDPETGAARAGGGASEARR